jgi:hypothetical protein
LDINKGKEIKKLEELKILDLAKDNHLDLDSDYIEQSKKAGFAMGFKVWRHYKNGKYYSLDQVIEYIQNYSNLSFGFSSPLVYVKPWRMKERQRANIKNFIINSENMNSENKQNTINRLHWNLYHKEI